MGCGKACGSGGVKLCPMAMGLAIGLVSAFAVIVMAIKVMYFGPSAMMAQMHLPMPGVNEILVFAGWGFLKGFLFGFFAVLFYDLISCCCKCPACKKSKCNSNCGSNCGCKGCGPDKQPEQPVK